MVAGDLAEWGKGLAIFVGIAVGFYAVFSTAHVWHTRQIFTWGSGALCAFGTVLILGSIFHNVSLVAGLQGVELRLAELKADVIQTRTLVENTNKQVAALQTKEGPQFASVQKSIEQIYSQLSLVSSKTDDALVGLRNINSKFDALPAYDRTQPDKQLQPQRMPFQDNRPIGPELAPAK